MEYRLAPSIPRQVVSRAYLRLWLRTPASTLPTRFPAALGIGHDPALRASLLLRSSIRRCLSMLRNTSDGNELALPATNALGRA